MSEVKVKKEKKHKREKKAASASNAVDAGEGASIIADVPSTTGINNGDEEALAVTAKAEKKSKKGKRKAENADDEESEAGEKAEKPLAEEEEEQVAEEPEVKAMSHKEKRLAKRKRLADEAAGIDPDAPKPQSAASVPLEGAPAVGNTPGKSAHGIWIGNLSFKTSSKHLLAWFEDKGLKDVLRINMPGGKRADELNRGFAYLDFPSATDVEVAVGLSEQHLDGRKLLIKSSTDYTGRPTPALPTNIDGSSSLTKTQKKILSKQKNQAGPTLFMGNLGFETTHEHIKEMFIAHQQAEKKPKEDELDDSSSDEGSDVEDGSDAEDEKPQKKKKKKVLKEENLKEKDAGIRKVRLGTFEDTGKCKGWAFVDFHSAEQATRALLNPRNHSLNGRALNVEYASAEAVRRGKLGTRAAVNAAKKDGGAEKRKREENGDEDGGNYFDRADKALRDRAAGYEGNQYQQREIGATEGYQGPPPVARKREFQGPRPTRDDRPPKRAKPGMALAMAQRASEAIVPSKGKKITF